MMFGLGIQQEVVTPDINYGQSIRLIMFRFMHLDSNSYEPDMVRPFSPESDEAMTAGSS